MRRNTIEDFWRRVDVRGADECWEWQGSKSSFGYGQIKLQGKMWYTHRLAFSTVQKVPDGMFVCHTCDNPPCCNPSHLFLGTNEDNSRDRDEKGRHRVVSGENHRSAKLTEPDVFYIKNADMTYRELARLFNISPAAVSNIKTGRTWKHLP